MSVVNRRTHWCSTCDAPTLHKQTEGLDDGRLHAVLHCERCGKRVVYSKAEISEVCSCEDMRGFPGDEKKTVQRAAGGGE